MVVLDKGEGDFGGVVGEGVEVLEWLGGDGFVVDVSD